MFLDGNQCIVLKHIDDVCLLRLMSVVVIGRGRGCVERSRFTGHLVDIRFISAVSERKARA